MDAQTIWGSDMTKEELEEWERIVQERLKVYHLDTEHTGETIEIN